MELLLRGTCSCVNPEGVPLPAGVLVMVTGVNTPLFRTWPEENLSVHSHETACLDRSFAVCTIHHSTSNLHVEIIRDVPGEELALGGLVVDEEVELDVDPEIVQCYNPTFNTSL